MNLKHFIITLSILFCSGLASAQYNYTQKLGNLATIKLPDSPKIKHVEGGELYLVHKGPIYIAQVGDVQGGFRDLFKKNNIDSDYNGYIIGTLKGTKGAKLFYKDKIKINGHSGIEFGYKAPLNDQQTYRYQHAVLVNDTLLMCGIWSSDSLSKDDRGLKPFFNGFKVKTTEQLNAESRYAFDYKLGKVLAALVLLCIPVLLGLGIVFIIRKFVYKKDQKQIIN